jgi:hypothetical protein
MSLYFVLMVPLSARIHLGLYRDGVWADDGFLPSARIGRMAFRETPEIVLILLPRGRPRLLRRRCRGTSTPRSARSSREKIRARILNVESGLLGCRRLNGQIHHKDTGHKERHRRPIGSSLCIFVLLAPVC